MRDRSKRDGSSAPSIASRKARSRESVSEHGVPPLVVMLGGISHSVMRSSFQSWSGGGLDCDGSNRLASGQSSANSDSRVSDARLLASVSPRNAQPCSA
eukprot:3279384-Prymnesium_polylepis.1